MSKRSFMRTTGICTGLLLIIFITFFYIIPIYNIRNRGEVIELITHAIVEKNEQELKKVLQGRNDLKRVEAGQIPAFLRFINTNKNNNVASEFSSSDDVIISVTGDSSEAMLVLSQKGVFSKWTLVNIRFLQR